MFLPFLDKREKRSLRVWRHFFDKLWKLWHIYVIFRKTANVFQFDSRHGLLGPCWYCCNKFYGYLCQRLLLTFMTHIVVKLSLILVHLFDFFFKLRTTESFVCKETSCHRNVLILYEGVSESCFLIWKAIKKLHYSPFNRNIQCLLMNGYIMLLNKLKTLNINFEFTIKIQNQFLTIYVFLHIHFLQQTFRSLEMPILKYLVI